MERLTEWYDNGISEGVLVKEKRGENGTDSTDRPPVC